MKKQIKIIKETNILPIGAKNKECVKCLWYSIKRSGSFSDLIKISKSGAMPPIAPHKEAFRISLFLERREEKVAPIKPWVHGSINFYSGLLDVHSNFGSSSTIFCCPSIVL